MSSLPSVVVAGGGPSGLVAAILFGQRGIATTVVERSSEPDPWSTKSYSIVLGAKGMAALTTAGCLQLARERGMKREFIIFHSPDGSTKVMPKQNPNSMGFSRPILVECLESIASKQPYVTILKGSGVKSVRRLPGTTDDDSFLEVMLEDGSSIQATHVVGADGKWSNVRNSFPTDFQATIRTEPSFGVHIMVPSVPDGWRHDGTHVMQPAKDCMFYIIAAPIPTGELSVSMVCYDETLERYPWLSPPGDNKRRGDWEDEYSARPETVASDTDLAEKLADMLQEELPLFLSAIGRENLASARINRRVSWVELNSSSDEEAVTFASSDGRVALIGDAARAVTPSMGEGCNMAMESAVVLVESLNKMDDDALTVDDLCTAFLSYGKSRPKETQPVQAKSASSSRFKKR